MSARWKFKKSHINNDGMCVMIPNDASVLTGTKKELQDFICKHIEYAKDTLFEQLECMASIDGRLCFPMSPEHEFKLMGLGTKRDDSGCKDSYRTKEYYKLTFIDIELKL